MTRWHVVKINHSIYHLVTIVRKMFKERFFGDPILRRVLTGKTQITTSSSLSFSLSLSLALYLSLSRSLALSLSLARSLPLSLSLSLSLALSYCVRVYMFEHSHVVFFNGQTYLNLKWQYKKVANIYNEKPWSDIIWMFLHLTL